MDYVLDLGLASALFWATTLAWLAEPLVFPSPPRRSRRLLREGRRTDDQRPGRTTWSAGSETTGSAALSRAERLAMIAAILGVFALAAALDHLMIGAWPDAPARALRAAGLGLYAGGAALRYWAASALGAAFSRDVRPESVERLVESGPYRFLRHPLYLGLYALGVGLVAQLGNPLGAVAAAVLVAAPIAVRARREERELRAALPERYEVWSARRPRVLPGLF